MPPPVERRDFARRPTSLSGELSPTQGAGETWPVTVRNISLTGMLLVGELPVIENSRIYLVLEGTHSRIPCDLVSQNANGVRVKIKLDDLEIDQLMQESDTYASLILESIPGIYSAR
ncbi:PilZ domain-containing protein [Nisaea acidiphila]|uniref:PilZ domain-containing protein n=2 Tax=Nisaea acidiphila TaxID=1862145 RepID=A0A9J7AXX3_9PROT|nr:PilZ domain-containing protein [Nisaea acidiphila]